MLPNFIICGSPKSGTTSLYHYLNQHPDICFSSIKEPFYFCSDKYENQAGWYESLFENCLEKKVVGEATPWYMRNKNSPERIFRTIPYAKLLFLMRNPIERAYSSYWFSVQRGHLNINTSFSQIIRFCDQNHTLVSTGFYFEQISRFIALFPLEQLFFLTTDELKSSPTESLQKICKFLEVDSSFVPELSRINKTVVPRNQALYRSFSKTFEGLDAFLVKSRYLRPVRRALFFSKNTKPPAMLKSDRDSLREIYKEDIRLLSIFLNRDLSHWQ